MLWALLQARSTAGEKAMMPVNLLFWGICIFLMLLIGLALTVREFRNM